MQTMQAAETTKVIYGVNELELDLAGKTSPKRHLLVGGAAIPGRAETELLDLLLDESRKRHVGKSVTDRPFS